MRVSNTKISSLGVSKPNARDIIYDFMSDNALAEIYQNEETRVTVLVNREFNGSNTVRVSTAIASPDEAKFRKLVGKFLAVENMQNGKYIDIPVNQVSNVLFAIGIAY